MTHAALKDLVWLKAKAIVAESGCWEMQRVGNKYGTIRLNGRSQLAHRVSWQVARGEIPEGLLICHRCNNKKCINPDHLYLGTPSDNCRDAWRDGLNKKNPGLTGWAKKNAAKDVCNHGHLLTDENVYVTARGRRHCRACQARMNLEFKRRKRLEVNAGANT